MFTLSDYLDARIKKCSGTSCPLLLSATNLTTRARAPFERATLPPTRTLCCHFALFASSSRAFYTCTWNKTSSGMYSARGAIIHPPPYAHTHACCIKSSRQAHSHTCHAPVQDAPPEASAYRADKIVCTVPPSRILHNTRIDHNSEKSQRYMACL